MKHVLTLEGIPPSKKNAKNVFSRGGRIFVISSKKYLAWEEEQSWYVKQWQGRKAGRSDLTLKKLIVTFCPKDKRKFDISNKFESVADLLVKNKIIVDDNYIYVPHIEAKINTDASDKGNTIIELEV